MTSISGTPDLSAEEASSAPVRRNPRFVKSYTVGRTCVHAGCETVISRYNAENVCWRHADEERDRRVRR